MDRLPADLQTFQEVVDRTAAALEPSGIGYAFMGGIAATTYGGHRFTHDIDIFVKPEDAVRALGVLEGVGFTTAQTDPLWLYKAWHSEVEVDVIFKSAGPVYFDEAMHARSAFKHFNGHSLRVLAPEDLFVIKALVLNEHSLSLDDNCIRHLKDLLGILRTCELDWEYLLGRARLGPRRILGLLLYAQSLDLMVPNRVVQALARALDMA